MNKPMSYVVMCLIGLLSLAGCSGGQEPLPTNEPVSLPPTSVPATAVPTAAPSPTPTPLPPPPSPTLPPAPDASPTPEATVTPAPSATVEATEEPLLLTPIGELHGGVAGQEVTIEGSVVGAASFSGGFKFTLDDGTGQVVLLMWHDVYDDCWDAAGINLGARVRAAGEVGEFEGELQVVPSWGGAVKTLEPAAAWAEAREIGSLSGADEGRRVMIEGQVLRTEGTSSAVKVFVADDSGEVLVFIWRNVLERVPDNVGLGTPGSRVRVVGTVSVYEGNLELIPTLPYDVVVLEVP
ncbi:MAG: hypothetical protein JW900_00760 [Anaerolineae bacterium]|nr:hypothetical protein [Anaerolineae bacterium]